MEESTYPTGKEKIPNKSHQFSTKLSHNQCDLIIRDYEYVFNVILMESMYNFAGIS